MEQTAVLPKPEFARRWLYKNKEIPEHLRGFLHTSPEIAVVLPVDNSFVDEYSLPDLQKDASLYTEVAYGRVLLPANDWWRLKPSSIVKTSVTAQTGTRYMFLCPWDPYKAMMAKALSVDESMHKYHARLTCLPLAEFSHDEWHTMVVYCRRLWLHVVATARTSSNLKVEKLHDDLVVDLPQFHEDPLPPGGHTPNPADVILPLGMYDPIEMAYWTYYLNHIPVRRASDLIEFRPVVPLRTKTTGTRAAYFWLTESLAEGPRITSRGNYRCTSSFIISRRPVSDFPSQSFNTDEGVTWLTLPYLGFFPIASDILFAIGTHFSTNTRFKKPHWYCTLKPDGEPMKLSVEEKGRQLQPSECRSLLFSPAAHRRVLFRCQRPTHGDIRPGLGGEIEYAAAVWEIVAATLLFDQFQAVVDADFLDHCQVVDKWLYQFTKFMSKFKPEPWRQFTCRASPPVSYTLARMPIIPRDDWNRKWAKDIRNATTWLENDHITQALQEPQAEWRPEMHRSDYDEPAKEPMQEEDEMEDVEVPMEAVEAATEGAARHSPWSTYDWSFHVKKIWPSDATYVEPMLICMIARAEMERYMACSSLLTEGAQLTLERGLAALGQERPYLRERVESYMEHPSEQDLLLVAYEPRYVQEVEALWRTIYARDEVSEETFYSAYDFLRIGSKDPQAVVKAREEMRSPPSPKQRSKRKVAVSIFAVALLTVSSYITSLYGVFGGFLAMCIGMGPWALASITLSGVINAWSGFQIGTPPGNAMFKKCWSVLFGSWTRAVGNLGICLGLLMLPFPFMWPYIVMGSCVLNAHRMFQVLVWAATHLVVNRLKATIGRQITLFGVVVLAAWATYSQVKVARSAAEAAALQRRVYTLQKKRNQRWEDDVRENGNYEDEAEIREEAYTRMEKDIVSEGSFPAVLNGLSKVGMQVRNIHYLGLLLKDIPLCVEFVKQIYYRFTAGDDLVLSPSEDHPIYVLDKGVTYKVLISANALIREIDLPLHTAYKGSMKVDKNNSAYCPVPRDLQFIPRGEPFRNLVKQHRGHLAQIQKGHLVPIEDNDSMCDVFVKGPTDQWHHRSMRAGNKVTGRAAGDVHLYNAKSEMWDLITGDHLLLAHREYVLSHNPFSLDRDAMQQCKQEGKHTWSGPLQQPIFKSDDSVLDNTNPSGPGMYGPNGQLAMNNAILQNCALNFESFTQTWPRLDTYARAAFLGEVSRCGDDTYRNKIIQFLMLEPASPADKGLKIAKDALLNSVGKPKSTLPHSATAQAYVKSKKQQKKQQKEEKGKQKEDSDNGAGVFKREGGIFSCEQPVEDDDQRAIRALRRSLREPMELVFSDEDGWQQEGLKESFEAKRKHVLDLLADVIKVIDQWRKDHSYWAAVIVSCLFVGLLMGVALLYRYLWKERKGLDKALKGTYEPQAANSQFMITLDYTSLSLDDITAYRERGTSAWYKANLRSVGGHTQVVDQELQRKMEAALANGVNTTMLEFKTRTNQVKEVPVHIIRWKSQSAPAPKLYEPTPSKPKTFARKLQKVAKRVARVEKRLPSWATVFQMPDEDCTRAVMIPALCEWCAEAQQQFPNLTYEEFERTLPLLFLRKRELLLESDGPALYKKYWVRTPHIVDDPVTHHTEVIIPQSSSSSSSSLAETIVATETGTPLEEVKGLFNSFFGSASGFQTQAAPKLSTGMTDAYFLDEMASVEPVYKLIKIFTSVSRGNQMNAQCVNLKGHMTLNGHVADGLWSEKGRTVWFEGPQGPFQLVDPPYIKLKARSGWDKDVALIDPNTFPPNARHKFFGTPQFRPPTREEWDRIVNSEETLTVYGWNPKPEGGTHYPFMTTLSRDQWDYDPVKEHITARYQNEEGFCGGVILSQNRFVVAIHKAGKYLNGQRLDESQAAVIFDDEIPKVEPYKTVPLLQAFH